MANPDGQQLIDIGHNAGNHQMTQRKDAAWLQQTANWTTERIMLLRQDKGTSRR
jgi:hypothetical protein